MKISLITVTYNAEEFLEGCIASVLTQTHTNLEYIIIDGQSTDSTLLIVQKFKDRVDKFISEEDLGIYDAMNKGIAIATGDVIGILNADDFLADPAALDNIANQFSNIKTDIVYGDLLYVSRTNPNQIIRKWISKPYVRNMFQWGWMPAHPTFYARRELFQKYGGYNLSYKSAADYELMLRFLHKYNLKSKYLNKTFVKMRIGGISNNSFRNRLIASAQDFRAMHSNSIKWPWIAIILKPLRKVIQFI